MSKFGDDRHLDREGRVQRFKNILCVVSPHKYAPSAVRRASELASRQGASLTLVDVVPGNSSALDTTGVLSDEIRRELLDEGKTDKCSLASKIGVDVQGDVKVLSGIPFIEITKQVLRGQHDLLIKPMESPGNRLTRLGTTDKHLLRKCPCPVWIVKPMRKKTYGRILAAIDPDPGEVNASLNTLILDLSTSLAAREKAEVHTVSAWSVYEENRLRSRVGNTMLAPLLEEIRATHVEWLKKLTEPYIERGADIHVHLLKGKPSNVIPTQAEKRKCDLIVMGTVGHVGIPGYFIGTTAEQILSDVDCSVLAVKPDGFVSPVEA